MQLDQLQWTLYLFIIAFLLSLIKIYQHLVRNNEYWKLKGVPHEKPIPLFGNMFDVVFGKSVGMKLGEMYFRFKDPFFGIYVFQKPFLVLRDPELIKNILIKDFSNFADRSVYTDPKIDKMVAHFLFFVPNPEWRHVRVKTAPVFTSGKLKRMTPLVEEAAENMITYLEKMNQKDTSLEVKEVCAKFSTDVISSCSFGINANSFLDEDADFRRMGRLLFDFRWSTTIRHICHFFIPGFVKLVKMPFFDAEVTSYFRKAFWEALEAREKLKLKRNDLIDTIISWRETDAFKGLFDFEGDRVVAQAGMFFFAGFETVSSTMGFMLYELSLNEELQNRARSEAKSVLKSHGRFSYQAIKELTLLHKIACETLRKYPSLPFLDRVCAEDYEIPGSDVVLEKGTPVYIPMFGLHYDPEYFPDPHKFDPERFSEENLMNLPECCYLPFGDGPRNCIGQRLGLIATKMGIAKFLCDFKVERNCNTPVPMKLSTRTLLTASDCGLHMTLTKLN